MSADVPEGGEPGTGGMPVWHIVEHVPLPPGRALPAPRSANPAHWDALDEANDEADGLTDELAAPARTTEQRMGGGERGTQEPASGSSLLRRGTEGPSTRPLITDLDNLLTRAREERAGGWQPPSHIERLTMAEQRDVRSKRRRSRAVRLLVVALLVVAGVCAYLAIGAHLPHLPHLSHVP